MFSLFTRREVRRNFFPLLLFAPSVFCLLLAMAVVSYPEMTVAFAGALLLSLALLFFVLGLKLLEMRRRAEAILEQFKGRVMVQTLSSDVLQSPPQAEEEEVDLKKVILH